MAARLAAALWKHKPYWVKVDLSNRYVYAKVLRSHDGMPLVHVNTRDPRVAEGLESKSDKRAAAKVGKLLAIQAMELNIHGVGYQRPKGKRYHGKLASLLDAMVDTGLKLV